MVYSGVIDRVVGRLFFVVGDFVMVIDGVE